ncbi:MAG: DUF1266 domain-containing protein [Sphingobacterium sp.]|uniref:DUF1266 domain-containing protein n=1 Tax=Sphingobacterium sp. TaxID=341027 RepID=UPI00283A0C5A|nr:DUF1266 domain-containing protein [Sphingobacterium sp.]MDR0264150.1 DUF1266 domain-containing protein [Sphingobacterium sp.]
MMFKFFRELLNAAREGVTEAKEELTLQVEQERKGGEGELVTDGNILRDIPYEEQFGNALGAAFRVIVFGDWFTVFGSTGDDGNYPIHLYQFGNYPKIDQYRDDFIKLLKRDFAITDMESCLEVLTGYFTLLGIDRTGTALEGKSGHIGTAIWDISKPGVNAFAVAVTSYIVTSATDVGYLSKPIALTILKNLSLYAKKHFSDWLLFADHFLEGENQVGLNNKIGKSYLKRYIGYLKGKKGSPWNNVEWRLGNQSGILLHVAWRFQRKRYRSIEEFDNEVNRYQKDTLENRNRWSPNQIVVEHSEIEVCYLVWIRSMEDLKENEYLLDDEADVFCDDNVDNGYYQVELCARLKSPNGRHFTALDLLYQLEKQVSEKELGDHIFFEGLDAIEKDEEGIPMFYLSCGKV